MLVHLVSGFLGSGKTTAIAGAARRFREAGSRVAAITNDQGSELVDSAFLESRGIATGEVAGGCFCCSFGSLASELERLGRRAEADIVFAEAVGSCTDLAATVARPLASGFAEGVDLASHSAFVDIRLMGMWLSGMGLPFASDVAYIFESQLAEAELLVINKSDLVTRASADEILRRARMALPGKGILLQSSLDPARMGEWCERISGSRARCLGSMEVDYDRYASGEARLAWYNARVELRETRPSLGAAVASLMAILRRRFLEGSIAVGHAKLFVQGRDASQKLSMTFDTEWENASMESMDDDRGELLLNFRVEAAADLVERIVGEGLAELMESGLVGGFDLRDEQAFHPGYPRPTHRLPR
jgi:G3E family GTPase